jgi:GTP-binding protein Era
MSFKSGYCAIIGRPNVGKSTLLNAILGEQLAIVTPKPQTTRHRITGIMNQDDAQIIFIDTPGYHESSKPLNQFMNALVNSVINDADVVAIMVEADQDDVEMEKELFERIGGDRAIVVVNKADKISRSKYEKVALRFKDEWGAKELVIISALNNMGVITLVDAIKERLPEGEKLFPDDIYTTHNMRFIASEIIREQVFLQMQQEIPYSTAITIDEYKDATEQNPVTMIKAAIIIEKESQKGMIIGKGGARIKEIGKGARIKIEEILGSKVYLELFVRVEENWTKNVEKIRQFMDV